nr:MAG TPA: hypothetical protein [Caudoviricetes sp.]
MLPSFFSSSFFFTFLPLKRGGPTVAIQPTLNGSSVSLPVPMSELT